MWIIKPDCDVSKRDTDITLNKIYLKWNICIHLKVGHHLGPGFKLLAFRVDVIVKHGALGGELDGFELAHPPFAELRSVVDELDSHRDTEGVRVWSIP